MSFTKPKTKPVSVMVRRFTPNQAQELLDKSEEMANKGKAEARDQDAIQSQAWKYTLRAFKLDATSARELLE